MERKVDKMIRVQGLGSVIVGGGVNLRGDAFSSYFDYIQRKIQRKIFTLLGIPSEYLMPDKFRRKKGEWVISWRF